jgi:hypothetical protein
VTAHIRAILVTLIFLTVLILLAYSPGITISTLVLGVVYLLAYDHYKFKEGS